MLLLQAAMGFGIIMFPVFICFVCIGTLVLMGILKRSPRKKNNSALSHEDQTTNTSQTGDFLYRLLLSIIISFVSFIILFFALFPGVTFD